MPSSEDQNSMTLEEAVYWLAYCRIDSSEEESFDLRGILNRIKRETGGLPLSGSSHEKDTKKELIYYFNNSKIYAVGRFRNKIAAVRKELDYRLRFPDSTDDISYASANQDIHGGDFSEIFSEHWAEGQIDWKEGKLISKDWEFSDIRVPSCCLRLLRTRTESAHSFVVQGIDLAPTPYLKLVSEAVLHFWKDGLPPEDKKETIVEWLKSHDRGLTISDHMAGVMATMIRPPEAGIGGNKPMRKKINSF
ncbi:MAG: hypothetical protein HQL95_02765 [Magnetococcales bacterium]|nr:hypothetical protein [Magnetococcales bacterium]